MDLSGIMSAVILHNEPQTSQNLTNLLGEQEDISIKGTAHKLKVGLEMLRKYQPDIFFLDEYTLVKYGNQLLDELLTQNEATNIVLACSSEENAILALKYGVPNYLISPFDRNKLQLLVERLRASIQIRTLKFQLETLLLDKQDEKLMLSTKSDYSFVKPKKIVFCKAESNYTSITLSNKKTVLITKSLGHFYEKTLTSPCFIRISRSLVINKQYLTEIKKSNKTCVLKVGKQLYYFAFSPEYYKTLTNSNFSKRASLNKNIHSHMNMIPSLNNNIFHHN